MSLKLKYFLYISLFFQHQRSQDECFEKKEIAETNSFATYECAEVNAVVKDEKIISIIEEIRVLE